MNESLKDMTMEEIEIEFDKLEDKAFCLQIDLDQAEETIQFYRDREDEGRYL